jgi:NAD(P)H-dependent FMN reductase
MTNRQYDAHDRPLLQVILGSTRADRHGETVARWFADLARERPDFRTELLDLRDWPLPFFDQPRSPSSGHRAPEARAWAETIDRGDAYVIVTPEYNHSFPAVLKNAIDHLYHEWMRKPVGFVGYGGADGGVRPIEQLRQVVIELQMAPIKEAVVIPRARSAFGPDGQPLEGAHERRAVRLLDELAWWTNALRAARREDLAVPA